MMMSIRPGTVLEGLRREQRIRCKIKVSEDMQSYKVILLQLSSSERTGGPERGGNTTRWSSRDMMYWMSFYV
ncbi:hypothetical protein MA16_Dca025832 [Dendrobium catenatum]|uniref:Uncharacterized protein n=1 Tax=Dendrobium catenatum TaxID=906689 RepID=A0A2I0VAV4_9ASPA|nr:hypothetical protein MA16_Dca025832 [Dendrobium catenatum]